MHIAQLATFKLLLIFVLTSCETTNTSDSETLLEGRWKIITIDDKGQAGVEGYQFAPNKQYFRIDSQGRIVPKLMERIWEINQDTLKLVDYNYEPDFIEKKGTFIYHIQKLTAEELILKQINTQPNSVVILEKVR